jgi:hypothetical protein
MRGHKKGLNCIGMRRHSLLYFFMSPHYTLRCGCGISDISSVSAVSAVSRWAHKSLTPACRAASAPLVPLVPLLQSKHAKVKKEERPGMARRRFSGTSDTKDKERESGIESSADGGGSREAGAARLPRWPNECGIQDAVFAGVHARRLVQRIKCQEEWADGLQWSEFCQRLKEEPAGPNVLCK